MSTIGSIFRVTTFGESHSTSVGVVVDGCPPKMPLSEVDIQPQLTRRRPGQSQITTSRAEMDVVKIHCGVEDGYTLGAPIMLLVTNKDYVKKDYIPFKNVPRPSHADYTYKMKYGINASSGGGRASARETIGRIAAGAIAEKWLKSYYGVEIIAWVSSVGKISAPEILTDKTLKRNAVDKNIVRCPDEKTAEEMIGLIKRVKESGDSIGGIVTCVCRNVPVGLGEPVFDKIKAKLAQAMLSIPACTGFDYGSGFKGMQGGITNGNDIVFRVGFKPVSTILKPQKTVDYDGVEVELLTKGRHDPCVLPRAVPIVESMAAVVLIDAALIQIQRKESVLKEFDSDLNI